MAEEKQGASRADGWVDPEAAVMGQDTFRKVYLGEVADPLFPPHPAPPETPEDELTEAALADATPQAPEFVSHRTAWRLIFLLVLAVAALAYIFGGRR
jgi:hypothetical protein